MKSLEVASSKLLLVVTSVQESNKYTRLIIASSGAATKQIRLTNAKYGRGRLTAELYNQGDRKSISLTEKELKIVSKR
jgi:hypothetical protein